MVIVKNQTVFVWLIDGSVLVNLDVASVRLHVARQGTQETAKQHFRRVACPQLSEQQHGQQQWKQRRHRRKSAMVVVEIQKVFVRSLDGSRLVNLDAAPVRQGARETVKQHFHEDGCPQLSLGPAQAKQLQCQK
eukprot:TRINITY_DN28292_c0_g2_i1.p1 TRINITY_DN28292_c0_g2~~TRINITY_DN28292_c0_g2_i1.p1  ORF type:complete len:134 (+),score=28.60 TRINITY_DN28292_c0_g2_i1:506-907(+)